MKAIIHVNQHKIKSNRKNLTEFPVLTCKTYKDNVYSNEFTVVDKDGEGVGKFIYRPNNPLPCGAHVWFETESHNIVLGDSKCQIQKQ